MTSTRRFGSVLVLHARQHLAWGTSLTLDGWYGRDAVERTLATDGSDADARSLAAFARRLRAVSETICPTPKVAAPTKWQAYDPVRPYTRRELEQMLDFADSLPKAWMGQRFRMLLWLGIGTGITPAEHKLLSPPCFTLTETALVLNVPGPTARAIPVRHECERPLLELLADLPPSGSLYQGLAVGDHEITLVGTRTVHRHPNALRPTSHRLRATWMALVLSGPVPMAALLEAANLRGDRSFGDVARALTPADPLEAVHALRGSSAPLPAAGQLLLPGHHHPAPHVPLRTDGQDPR